MGVPQPDGPSVVTADAARWRIVIADQLPEAGWEILRAEPGLALAGPIADRAELLAALAGADALILRAATRVDAELLDAAPRLRVIGRAGASLDGIDLDVCTERGILVQSVPYANVDAVAELTFGLLLAAARGIPQGYAALRRGEFPRHEMLGFQLSGKQLGLVGFGRLGRAVALRARAFGMQVLVYDPYVDLSFAHEQGVEVLGLDELLARSDVLSLNTVLTEQTRHLIDAAALARMKPSATIVNCTHAGLIDETALLAALDAGQLAWAALDTLQQEPPPADHPLLAHPRVVALPHLNQNTVESQADTGRSIARDLLDALAGRDFRSVANLPFADETPYSEAEPYLRLAEKLGRLQGQLAEGWIQRLEVEVLGEQPGRHVRAIAACLLAGMLRPASDQRVNWISAPSLAAAQGIQTAQARDLVQLGDYPNLLACRLSWEGGSRTVAGALFANGEARLVQYEGFRIDAHPEGPVLIIENDDRSGVIGRVGTLLGEAGVNIASWRYGRQRIGGRALSFINLDQALPAALLDRLCAAPEIHRARQLRL